jgi:hypothetical protein
MTPGQSRSAAAVARTLRDGRPLAAYPVLPGCLAAAGVVDRPACGLADTRPAAPARTPVLRRAACSRRSRRARHRLDLVEHPERQRDTLMSDSKSPVRVIDHLDLLAREPARERRRVQQQHHPVVAQCEIAGNRPLLAPSQDLIETVGLRALSPGLFSGYDQTAVTAGAARNSRC